MAQALRLPALAVALAPQKIREDAKRQRRQDTREGPDLEEELPPPRRDHCRGGGSGSDGSALFLLPFGGIALGDLFGLGRGRHLPARGGLDLDRREKVEQQLLHHGRGRVGGGGAHRGIDERLLFHGA